MRARGGRIFLAGASGAVGRRLCHLLIADGWTVIGTTRSPEKAAQLGDIGVEAVVVDVFDEAALRDIMWRARPTYVVHQLTDLPPALDPEQMPAALVRNARLREIGTRNLLAAAALAGAKRLVAQSIAFAYEPGPMPFREEMPLDVDSPGFAATVRAVASLETQVLNAPVEGVVLRYGMFYGTGTGFDQPAAGGAVHVDAAADAARRALTRGEPGIYNVAEEDGTVCSDKARRVLGWEPTFRLKGA